MNEEQSNFSAAKEALDLSLQQMEAVMYLFTL
jgi:hypothetical protein